NARTCAPTRAWHGRSGRGRDLCGEDVLGPRGTHRIEGSLDDASLLKRPQTLRYRRRGIAFQRVLQLLKAPWPVQEKVAQDKAGPTRSDDADRAGHRGVSGVLMTAGVLSAALIGWVAVAQYLGAANTYFAAADTAVPTVLFGLLIP